MDYELRVADKAASYLARLDRRTRQRIIDRLDQIANDPFAHYTKPLSNARGKRSSRVGSWRIVYSVNDADRVIDVS